MSAEARETIGEALVRREAGVLLHVTSLPGDGEHGTLGAEARAFIDWMVESGLTVWQVLPLGPTQQDDSPYQSSSAHAGNPDLIDLAELHRQGWLDERPGGDAVQREQALQHAADAFLARANTQQRRDYEGFCQAQAYWLDDFVLFQSLSEETSEAWWNWPDSVRRRDPQALAEARQRLARPLRRHTFEQYVFFRQWEAIKHYANARDIRLFGDMPIFVAHNSAEVWARPQDFYLDEHGHTTVVAGVPPDYFSDTGQRWGNPLYNWERLAADGFDFWIDRMRTQLHMFDLLRIDHFRGLEAYWEVPASEPTAIHGRWVKAPGDKLLDRLHEIFHPLPLVAEDLGVITPEVEALRDRHGLPGMRVMQFGFFGDDDNPHRLHNHVANAVVYTGTHDNDTSLGWYQHLSEEEQRVVAEQLGGDTSDMPWPLIELTMTSPALLVVVPMQDYLGLGSEHRMNVPGTSEGNWRWRFHWSQLPGQLATRIRETLARHQRLVG